MDKQVVGREDLICRQPESEWPISQVVSILQIPEVRFAMTCGIDEIDNLVNRIGVDRFSSYLKLLRVTARVLLMYSRYPRLSFANVANNLVRYNLDNAEMFWIRDA